MNITAVKVIRPVPFKEYAREYGETAAQVWVNPPQAVRKQATELSRERRRILENAAQQYEEESKQVRKKITPAPEKPDPEQSPEYLDYYQRWLEWLVLLWSQAPDPSTHWTADEIRQAEAADPGLMSWLTVKTFELLGDLKKA